MHKNSTKFGSVFSDICDLTDRQTDKHTHHNTSYSYRGQSNNNSYDHVHLICPSARIPTDFWSHTYTNTALTRGVDPCGTGGHVPSIFMKGDIHGNVPQYFRSDVVYDVYSSDINCCLLYFNVNIMCSFTKKASSPRPPIPGLRPWTPLGDFVPRTPTGTLPLDPAGVLRPPVFFYVPL